MTVVSIYQLFLMNHWYQVYDYFVSGKICYALVACFMLSRYFSDLSVGVGAFVIELSKISSFFP